MTVEKAVPVVLRQRGGIEILAFRHPSAGLQIVKGTVEAGEAVPEAALRELSEEAGVTGARVTGSFGSRDMGYGPIWHFVRVAPPDDLPESWVHHCEDEGGQDFAFFWHPLDAVAGEVWHPLFRDALAHIRGMVG